jgi:hypothetical protein
MEPPVCKNIRSRRHPDQRCPNPASTGDYCGIHYKHPRPFQSQSQIAVRKASESNDIFVPVDPLPAVLRIQKWWRVHIGLVKFNKQGPARWLRSVSTNATDFFSMEEITDISGEYLFSFRDADKMVYTFDIRSMAALLEKAGAEPAQNPYNRQPISADNIKKAIAYVKWARKKGLDTRWAPVEPTTPLQQFAMKVTDLFQKIDELNYYTNSAWFTEMVADDHRCFYVELHDIWYHRAELSNEMRNTIIPTPARPFRYPIREVVAQKSLDFLRKTNMDLIRMFISAATHRSDRILGAMYVITAMTLVNTECAASYPWLFESATPGIYARYRLFTNPQPNDLYGNNLLNLLMNSHFNIPPLILPGTLITHPTLGGGLLAGGTANTILNALENPLPDSPPAPEGTD